MPNQTLKELLKYSGSKFFWATGVHEVGQQLDVIPKTLVIMNGMPYYSFVDEEKLLYTLKADMGSIRIAEEVNGEYRETDKVFDLDKILADSQE